jgi:hypothetical protein
MSGIPQTKMLGKIGRRRKMVAFLAVATATFFCLSLIWPLSIKSWRSESEISLKLTKRTDSSVEFNKLLTEVVQRHTSVDAISRSLETNGLGIENSSIAPSEIATEIKKRLSVAMIPGKMDPDDIRIRVGLDGEASEKENYFVNVLATTIAKDFMTSPLAGILPTETLPVEDIESLQQRHREIEQRATELLAQIRSNLQRSAEQLVEAESSIELPGTDSSALAGLREQLDTLASQRKRIANSGGDTMLELAAIDQQIQRLSAKLESQTSNSQDGPFRLASNRLNRTATNQSLNTLLDSLRSSISELANVAAEACTAVEAASRTRPAFSIKGVRGRSPSPVGAIPKGKEFLFLTLASVVFASIVSAAYQPFAQRGFESVSHIGRQLNLPVIATLETKNEFEDVTGPGIPAEQIKPETPGSNQVVNICKWILFCSLMLTIGFCLVNSDIRDAFFVSPFHGFAEIVWTLKGN